MAWSQSPLSLHSNFLRVCCPSAARAPRWQSNKLGLCMCVCVCMMCDEERNKCYVRHYRAQWKRSFIIFFLCTARSRVRTQMCTLWSHLVDTLTLNATWFGFFFSECVEYYTKRSNNGISITINIMTHHNKLVMENACGIS